MYFIENELEINAMLRHMAKGATKKQALNLAVKERFFTKYDVKVITTEFVENKCFNVAVVPVQNFLYGYIVPTGAVYGYLPNGNKFICTDVKFYDIKGELGFKVLTPVDYSSTVIRETRRGRTEYSYKKATLIQATVPADSWLGTLIELYSYCDPVIVPFNRDQINRNYDAARMFRDKRPSERENAVPHQTAGSKHTEIKPRELYRKDGKLRYRAKYHATLSERVNAAM